MEERTKCHDNSLGVFATADAVLDWQPRSLIQIYKEK
jgi:hypothetical protein